MFEALNRRCLLVVSISMILCSLIFSSYAYAAVIEELRVNSNTTDLQGFADVAINDAGQFVVVWQSGRDEDVEITIYGQCFDADGTPAGGEFQVSTTPDETMNEPVVDMNAQGDFVVAWFREGYAMFWDNIYLRRFAFGGSPLSEEFVAVEQNAHERNQQSVSMHSTGAFVVSWTSDGQEDVGEERYGAGIFARLFDSDGVPVGEEFHVNTTVDDAQKNSQTDMDSDGNLVVLWMSKTGIKSLPKSDDRHRILHWTDTSLWTELSGDGDLIIADQDILDIKDRYSESDRDSRQMPARGGLVQYYQASGEPIGEEILLIDSVRVRSIDGAFIRNDELIISYLIWIGYEQTIHASIFNASGELMGSDVEVTGNVNMAGGDPHIAVNGDGGFVIAWPTGEGLDGLGDYEIMAREYDSDNNPLGDEFQVNVRTEGTQAEPAVAMNASGTYVIVWHSNHEGDDNFNVYLSAFNLPGGGDDDDSDGEVDEVDDDDASAGDDDTTDGDPVGVRGGDNDDDGGCCG